MNEKDKDYVENEIVIAIIIIIGGFAVLLVIVGFGIQGQIPQGHWECDKFEIKDNSTYYCKIECPMPLHADEDNHGCYYTDCIYNNQTIQVCNREVWVKT